MGMLTGALRTAITICCGRGSARPAGRPVTAFDLDGLGRLAVDLVFPPAVSIAALTFATVLAV